MQIRTLFDIELDLLQCTGPNRLSPIRNILDELEAYNPKCWDEGWRIEYVQEAAKIAYMFDVPYTSAEQYVHKSHALSAEDLAGMLIPYPDSTNEGWYLCIERDILFANWFAGEVLDWKIPDILRDIVDWSTVYNKIAQEYDIFKIGNKYFSWRIDDIKG